MILLATGFMLGVVATLGAFAIGAAAIWKGM